MFLFTVKLLAKVDRKLGVEIEIESLERLTAAHDEQNGNGNGNGNSHENSSNSNSGSSSSGSGGSSSNGHHNHNSNSNSNSGSSSGSQLDPPAAVRQRRCLRRLKQEIERMGVWCKRDISTNCLTHQGSFALKLLGTYVPPNSNSTSNSNRSSGGNSSSSCSSNSNGHRNNNSSSSSSSRGDNSTDKTLDPLPSLLGTLSDILRFHQVTGSHVQRLCVCYFG